MPPDPVLGLLSALGLFVYATSGVAIHGMLERRLLPKKFSLVARRVGMTLTVLSAWGFWIYWAVATTDFGKPTAQGGLSVLGGAFVALGSLAIIWSVDNRCFRQMMSFVWPLLLPVSLVGLLARPIFLTLRATWAGVILVATGCQYVAKGPIACGNYIAKALDSREIV